MDENKENEGNSTQQQDQNLNDIQVRRAVRADYRSLANEIDENGEEIINPESERLFDALKITEELFSKVRHPREAVHDSTVLLKLCQKGREQAQQLKTDVISFDNHTFSQKLISYLHGRNIADIVNNDNDEDVHLPESAWERLGDRASPMFRTAPKFDFLLGPLVLEVMPPKEKQARRRSAAPSGELVKLKQVEKVAEQEEATTREVSRIQGLLRKHTNEGKNSICFFRFIINPTSFGQTVENLFHLSFLIKDGKAAIELDENGLPILNSHKEYSEKDYPEAIPRKQVVMPLSINDWEELIEVYGITEPLIPTRT